MGWKLVQSNFPLPSHVLVVCVTAHCCQEVEYSFSCLSDRSNPHGFALKR
ncbi:hypothetical protein M758_12G057500 [Ceratodon purpureus]|nr:hypothetical protein M758_12G057500 [Ceratodon purpureus]